jgi:hypothetical protein
VEAALSDPLTMVLAPRAVARLLAVPTRRDRWVVLTYSVAVAVQLVVVLTAQRATGHVGGLGNALIG